MSKVLENNFHAKEQAALARALEGMTYKAPSIKTRNKAQKESGVTGIFWHSGRKRWIANAKVNGKRYYAGTSPDLETAKAMALKLQKELLEE